MKIFLIRLLSIVFFLTASVIKLHAQIINDVHQIKEPAGAIIKFDTTQKSIHLMFTAHEWGEGIPFILKTFDSLHAQGSFFFTGDFIRKNQKLVQLIHKKGHYVGPHSDKHLLYCDWNKRDSLLLSIDSIRIDLQNNIHELVNLGIPKKDIRFFMPPYEWYNRTVYDMVSKAGLQLVNFTPGTSSNADYTTPDMSNYVSTDSIFNRIVRFETSHSAGLNGFNLLLHAGTDPKRKDKLYYKLAVLINYLKHKGYHFKSL